MKAVSSHWSAVSKSLFCFALGAMLFALSLPAAAQQPTKISRIGYLTNASLSADQELQDAFRQGMRDLGYVEGKNIIIEWRSGEGSRDRQRVLAAELVRLKVDVIVAGGTGDIRAAKEATSKIPIVMINGGDAVGNGFVASLARPGGNITGLSRLAPELSGKQLELLKETVPRLSRLAVLGSSAEPGNAQSLKEVELAAGAFGMQLQYLDVLSSKDIETAFRAAGKGRVDAVLVLSSPVTGSYRKEIADLAVKSRLPAIYWRSDFVEAGGLCPTAPALPICIAAPLRMWTRF
jgi:putative ABC transport system substrate-binding protein